MAGRQWSVGGGILGLRAELLTQPRRRAALHYDLLTHKLSLAALGTEALSWYDLHVFVQFVQLEPQSALATELHGPTWSIEGQLLAEVADMLAAANWQRAGRKSAPRPKRIPRPWEKVKSSTLGKDAIPISQFNDWWDAQGAKKASKKPPTSH